MKAHLSATLIFLLPCLAGAAAPEQIINSCLRTQSTQKVRYVDLSPADFSVEEDEDKKRNIITIDHRRRKYGIWQSTNSNDFGLVHGGTTLPIAKVKRIGSATPEPFDPYTAQWGEARFGKQLYLCITFNFEGLGQSGAFQNVRGAYAIDLRRPPTSYFAVGDIRTIKD